MITQTITIHVTYATDWQYRVGGNVPKLMMEALKMAIEPRHKQNKVEFDIEELEE